MSLECKKFPRKQWKSKNRGNRKNKIDDKGTKIIRIKPKFTVHGVRFLRFIPQDVRGHGTGKDEEDVATASNGRDFWLGEQASGSEAWCQTILQPRGEGGSGVPEDVHAAERAPADGAAEREHPLPDLLRHPHRPRATADQLQADRRHRIGACRQDEDTEASGCACRGMEAVHEGPRHDVHRRDVLRERDALPDGPEAAVGVRGEDIQDHVRDERTHGCPSSEDKVPRRGEGQPVVPQATQAQQRPDKEDDTAPSEPAREDTEGDPQDGA